MRLESAHRERERENLRNSQINIYRQDLVELSAITWLCNFLRIKRRVTLLRRLLLIVPFLCLVQSKPKKCFSKDEGGFFFVFLFLFGDKLSLRIITIWCVACGHFVLLVFLLLGSDLLSIWTSIYSVWAQKLRSW